MSLQNKVAIVTGASAGIGAAIALKLTEEGARVAIVGRNVAKLKNTSDTCEARGAKPLTIVADVSKDEDAKKIITETLNAFGKVDILVNNAGIILPARIVDDNALEVFHKTMATNLRAVVLLTHLASKHIVKSKGNIINISSSAGQTTFTQYYGAYCTSKAGLDHFGRCVAIELAPHGVRVNTISPGPVKTEIFETAGIQNAGSDEFWNRFSKATALNKVSESAEIADIVAFVASDKAKSITAETILVDNGATWNRHIMF